MKALKNESKHFLESIIVAVMDCYATAEPSNTELTKLYYSIGKNICEQGEKAFVVHLAESLAEKFPAIKGFSARNLRRMRDLYRTYENKPRLCDIALELGWTQNAVILDSCKTDDEYTFYLKFAKEKNLSKLALMRAIENMAYEPHDNVEVSESGVAAIVEPVCEDIPMTESNGECELQSEREPTVTACEPFLQGSGAQKNRMQNIADHRTSRENQKPPLPRYFASILLRNLWPPPSLCSA